MSSLHPQAVDGAELAPIPPGASECYWRGGHPLRGRRGFHTPDQPGPHQDPGLEDRYDPTPRIADLIDADTAVLVLARLLRTRRAPMVAHALAMAALSGWSRERAEQLGELCRRVWGNTN